jgi:hypothetical protein
VKFSDVLIDTDFRRTLEEQNTVLNVLTDSLRIFICDFHCLELRNSNPVSRYDVGYLGYL